MQNTDFFDIDVYFLLFYCTDWLTKLVVIVGGELDFQLVVHIPGASDPIAISPMRRFSSAVSTGPRRVTRPSMVMIFTFWRHGHVFRGDDFFANLRRGVHVGLAVALIKRR
jgi:hypothetical protein